MKKDQKQQIRNQEKQDLVKRRAEIAKELVSLKMDFVMGKLKNVHSMESLKKERAFINTVLSEK